MTRRASMFFADQNRKWVLPGLLAALALLAGVATDAGLHPRDGYWAALEDPGRFEGRSVVVSLFPVVHVDDPMHFSIQRGPRIARVEGDASAIVVGDQVTVSGRFRASDSRVVAAEVEVHSLRSGKQRLGIAAVFVLVVALPFWFALRGRRIIERA